MANPERITRVKFTPDKWGELVGNNLTQIVEAQIRHTDPAKMGTELARLDAAIHRVQEIPPVTVPTRRTFVEMEEGIVKDLQVIAIDRMYIPEHIEAATQRTEQHLNRNFR